jgi:hypothetical protein
MIFLFPKKTIVLDCFTDREYVIQASPITEATKHLTDWWKKLPNTYLTTDTQFPASTMKYCAGLVDYYRHSIALPLWCDLFLRITKTQFLWKFADSISEIETHNVKEEATGLFSNHAHIKIISPWKLHTKEDINWVFSHPLYGFSEENADIKVVPGSLNFSKQPGTHINAFVPTNQEKSYLLNQGQVLAHLTPMTDKKIKIVRHLVDKKEMDKIDDRARRITFKNKYKNIIEQKEKFANCPYSQRK